MHRHVIFTFPPNCMETREIEWNIPSRMQPLQGSYRVRAQGRKLIKRLNESTAFVDLRQLENLATDSSPTLRVRNDRACPGAVICNISRAQRFGCTPNN